MFNPLTPAETTTAMGRAARDAARSADPADGFVRAQLLSVYSASRHLGVELSSFDPEVRAFSAGVAGAIEISGASPDLGPLADELAETTDPRVAGELVCELLDRLREDDSAAARQLQSAVRSELVKLTDREVELLAAVIEGAADR